MISEDKFGLLPLWTACLEIYKEVAKICDRHGLRYYATDGTALGAVRHNGFIPWDDDLDISMPRPDYEKFMAIANKELPSRLRFWNYEDEPGFIFLFGKVQCVDKEAVIALEEKLGHRLSNGLFIDVFPIDGYPESKFEKFWVRALTTVAKSAVRFRCMRFRDQSRKGRITWLVGLCLFVVFPFVTQRMWLRMCDRCLKRNPFDGSPFTGRTCSRHNLFARAPQAYASWGVPTPHEFHDTEIMLPQDVDAHLRNEFFRWDYMQLPPEKDRHPSHEYSYRCPWWLGPRKGVRNG